MLKILQLNYLLQYIRPAADKENGQASVWENASDSEHLFMGMVDQRCKNRIENENTLVQMV